MGNELDELDILDDTRIHPTDYSKAVAMAKNIIPDVPDQLAIERAMSKKRLVSLGPHWLGHSLVAGTRGY